MSLKVEAQMRDIDILSVGSIVLKLQARDMGDNPR